MPGTPSFGSPPSSPPRDGGGGTPSAVRHAPSFSGLPGAASWDALSSVPPDVAAPKPPCNTPRRSNRAEPELRDELDVCSIEVAADPPQKWNAGPLAPPSVDATDRYTYLSKIGSGCFGNVHLAETAEGSKVAVKCVLPDAGREMREVELLRMINHPCVVPLLDTFRSTGPDGAANTVHIVMEYLPDILHTRIRGRPLPRTDIQLYGFQLLRSLAHLDGMCICHRDIKPENILLDGPTLKLADFGSAKLLGDGPSSSYICARWWRAPELVLGSTRYTTSIDWWSCGTVLAEMMLGRPIFTGSSSWGQMEAIVRALGTPTSEELGALCPAEGAREQVAALGRVEARPWQELLRPFASQPDALELVSRLLVYKPAGRWHPTEALVCTLFATLSEDLSALPLRIFDFTDMELTSCRPPAAELLRAGQGLKKL